MTPIYVYVTAPNSQKTKLMSTEIDKLGIVEISIKERRNSKSMHAEE